MTPFQKAADLIRRAEVESARYPNALDRLAFESGMLRAAVYAMAQDVANVPTPPADDLGFAIWLSDRLEALQKALIARQMSREHSDTAIKAMQIGLDALSDLINECESNPRLTREERELAKVEA